MRILVLMTPAVLCLGACASAGRGDAPLPPPPATAAIAPKPTPRTVVAMAPIPNPPEPGSARKAAVSTTDGLDPVARVARANAAALVQPSGRNYDGAAQTYPFAAGALYQVYTTPGRVTDIALEAGETLSGTGPVAAGDTTRWIIGDTRSGAGAELRVHILVKPTAPDLRTNLVINTDRRTYHVELRATASTYMALVAWRYPAGAPVAILMPAVPPAAADLNFSYRITGDRTTWRPIRVYDDGRQTIIEFPASVVQGEMPPLFVAGGRGRSPELVNYRVTGRRMFVDRLFERAELRLGSGRTLHRVSIQRVGEPRT